MECRGRWGTRPFGCRGGDGKAMAHAQPSPCSPSLPPSSETKPQLSEQPQQFAAQFLARSSWLGGAEARLCGALQWLPNGLLSGTDKRSRAAHPVAPAWQSAVSTGTTAALPSKGAGFIHVTPRNRFINTARLHETDAVHQRTGNSEPQQNSLTRHLSARVPRRRYHRAARRYGTSSLVVQKPSGTTLRHEAATAEHLPALVARAPAPSRAVLPPHPDGAGARPGAGLPPPHQRQLRLRADVWPGTERQRRGAAAVAAPAPPPHAIPGDSGNVPGHVWCLLWVNHSRH